MLKQHSFSNPFSGIKEKFQKSGRSNSAPGAYDIYIDRLIHISLCFCFSSRFLSFFCGSNLFLQELHWMLDFYLCFDFLCRTVFLCFHLLSQPERMHASVFLLQKTRSNTRNRLFASCNVLHCVSVNLPRPASIWDLGPNCHAMRRCGAELLRSASASGSFSRE